MTSFTVVLCFGASGRPARMRAQIACAFWMATLLLLVLRDSKRCLLNRQYSAVQRGLDTPADTILGQLVRRASGDGASIETKQTDAWLEQIEILKVALLPFSGLGSLHFEFSIPRLGKRIDVLALIGAAIFVIEFKAGEKLFTAAALDQVCDYALDLKNFHDTSHSVPMAPIVVPTRATAVPSTIAYTSHGDRVLLPIKATPATLGEVIQRVLGFVTGSNIDALSWEAGRYRPTPTIIEAAMALYGGHKVEEISKKDAGADNLAVTAKTVDDIIAQSKANAWKSICFVTGVPKGRDLDNGSRGSGRGRSPDGEVQDPAFGDRAAA